MSAGHEVVIPDAVYREVADATSPEPLPGWDPSLSPMRRDDDVPVPPEVIRHALDPGESSMVLALALSLAAAGDDVEVVLDEKKGRQAAQALGSTPRGDSRLVSGRQGPKAGSSGSPPLLDQLEEAGMYLGDDLRKRDPGGSRGVGRRRPNPPNPTGKERLIITIMSEFLRAVQETAGREISKRDWWRVLPTGAWVDSASRFPA